MKSCNENIHRRVKKRAFPLACWSHVDGPGRWGGSCSACSRWTPDATRLSFPPSPRHFTFCVAELCHWLSWVPVSRGGKGTLKLRPRPRSSRRFPRLHKPGPRHTEPQGRVRCAVQLHSHVPGYDCHHGEGGRVLVDRAHRTVPRFPPWFHTLACSSQRYLSVNTTNKNHTASTQQLREQMAPQPLSD